jgi:subtilase family serine protease
VGQPLGAQLLPSDAPHATAVGGTSILNDGTGLRLTGWGDVQVLLEDGAVEDPPEVFGFEGGAGGGESIYFPKPTWQASLSGPGRQTLDVSALADPYTGVPIVLTQDGVQYIEPGWGEPVWPAPSLRHSGRWRNRRRVALWVRRPR